jgi:hypothetical protein
MKALESARPASIVKSVLERALLGLCLVSLGLAPGLLSCKSQTLSSKTEDEARAMIPVPICVKRLPRGSTPGAIVSLAPEEYWPVLLPSFDNNASTIDPSAPDCSGRLTLSPLSPGANALRVNPQNVTLAPGADGMKIVWLQSHALGEKTFDGLLALVRQRESYMEVYALGIHRGRPEGTRFTLQRMGPRLVVEGTQEDCAGEASDRRCRASSSVYLLRTGMLKAAATYPIEQATRVTRDGNPVEYRFSASADYRDTSITLSEHLSVNTRGQGETRSSDLERAFRLEGGQLIASGESLWTKTLRELGQKPE